MAGKITYGGNYLEGANQKLIDILTRAAEGYGLQVEFTSGYRPGDSRQHGKRNALDITLIDPQSGKRFDNYQSAEDFRTYEQFAQTARQIQRKDFPELDSKFRWGGYFSSKKGPFGYGALDTMHFDLNGDKLGMAGGSWESGLNNTMRKAYPGVQSQGFADGPVPKVGMASDPPAPAVMPASLRSSLPAPGPITATPDSTTRQGAQAQVPSLYRGILPGTPTQRQMQAIRAVPGDAPSARTPYRFPQIPGSPTAGEAADIRVADLPRWDPGQRYLGGGLGSVTAGGRPFPMVPRLHPQIGAARGGVAERSLGNTPIQGGASVPFERIGNPDDQQIARARAARVAAPVPMPRSAGEAARAAQFSAQAVPKAPVAPTTYKSAPGEPFLHNGGVTTASLLRVKPFLETRPLEPGEDGGLFGIPMSSAIPPQGAAPPPMIQTSLQGQVPPIPATMSAGLRNRVPALPPTMQAPIPASYQQAMAARSRIPALQQRQAARAPIPALPSTNPRNVMQTATATNGYVYAKTPSGWTRIGGGTARPLRTPKTSSQRRDSGPAQSLV